MPLLLALLLLQAPALTPGNHTLAISFGERTRHYIVHGPSSSASMAVAAMRSRTEYRYGRCAGGIEYVILPEPR